MISGLPADSLVVQKSSGEDISTTAKSVMEKDNNKKEVRSKPNLNLAEDASKQSAVGKDTADSQLTSEANETYEASSEAIKIACLTKNKAEDFAISNSGSFHLM